MLDYDYVVNAIEHKIKAHSNSNVTLKDKIFNDRLNNRLTAALDDLKSIGKEDSTQQDLIVAWQVYRDCNHQWRVKLYNDNKFYILSGVYLLGVVSATVYRKLRNN